MKKCGDCHLFKNGCEFSYNDEDDTMKNFVACTDYIDKKEFANKLDKYEKKYKIGQ
jgi:hypothetical protein